VEVEGVRDLYHGESALSSLASAVARHAGRSKGHSLQVSLKTLERAREIKLELLHSSQPTSVKCAKTR
jgi:hypothetical protein